MFNLFRKKNKNPEPIFQSVVTDMHSHLLPMVDDGSKNVEESIQCLQTLHAVGFKKAIFTPHFQFPRFPNDEADIKRRFEEFRQVVAQTPDMPEIALGDIAGEYRIDSKFQERMEDGRFMLVGGKYLLVELSLHQQVMGIEELMFELGMKGYEVILAHPERYPYYSVGSNVLTKLNDMGIYFQVNILSLNGFYGDAARLKAFNLIENGRVDFLGTDTHNTLYAQALADASHNRKIQELLSTYTFKNTEL